MSFKGRDVRNDLGRKPLESFVTSRRTGLAGLVLVMVGWLTAAPAEAFCVRNDTGAPLQVEAVDGTTVFKATVDNNKKACCSPKDAACALTKAEVMLSITASEGDAACDVSVDPKGNVNVTGKPDSLKCKANKAGSTMDWASG